MTAADRSHPFGAGVAEFDERVDAWLERLRGNAIADAVFTNASHLGDWSLIWHLIGVTRGLGGAERRRQSLELAVLLGLESLIVNQGVKRLFRRTRPTEAGDERYGVRRPSTSSFPSGHASAGMFAAIVLTSMSGRRWSPLWFGVAAIVAVSRPFVRIHHASDIVGGAVVGLALGRVALAARRACA